MLRLSGCGLNEKTPTIAQRKMLERVITVFFVMVVGAQLVSGGYLRNPNEHTSIRWSPIATHVDFNAWVPGLAFNHDAVSANTGVQVLGLVLLINSPISFRYLLTCFGDCVVLVVDVANAAADAPTVFHSSRNHGR